MVEITLEFTPISVGTERRFKPIGKFSQMFCLLKDMDWATKEDIELLRKNGYNIIITLQPE